MNLHGNFFSGLGTPGPDSSRKEGMGAVRQSSNKTISDILYRTGQLRCL